MKKNKKEKEKTESTSRIFSPEAQEFIRENAKGRSSKELTELVNRKFRTEYNEKQIKSYKQRNKIRSGVTGCFEKGFTPWNKGGKVSPETYEKMKRTFFKKGSIPPRLRPVGSERISVEGYVEVKVDGHKNWKSKQRLIWEKENGKIPSGHVVIFADGNKQNFEIDNLICVSRAVLCQMNKNGLVHKNADLTKAGVAITRLSMKIKDIQKKKKESKK